MGSRQDPGEYKRGNRGERWEFNMGRVVRPTVIGRVGSRRGRHIGRLAIVSVGSNKRASGRNGFHPRLSDRGNRWNVGRGFRNHVPDSPASVCGDVRWA